MVKRISSRKRISRKTYKGGFHYGRNKSGREVTPGEILIRTPNRKKH